jgi:uncharacterized protein with HEPN domain
MPHDATKLLEDIQKAGTSIQTFLHGVDFARYTTDELLRAGVERKFTIVGEALSRLLLADAALTARITDYRRIIDFRHVLVHGYSKVDDQIVWDAAQHYLPILLSEVAQLIRGLQTP